MEDHVELTGLPVRHEDQAGVARQASLHELAAGLPPASKTRGFPDCFIQAALTATGDVTITRGPGAVRISSP